MVNLFTNKTFQNIKIFLQNVTLQIGLKKVFLFKKKTTKNNTKINETENKINDHDMLNILPLKNLTN